MTVTSSFDDRVLKDFQSKIGKVTKIRLIHPDPTPYLRLEQRGNGTRGSGRFHQIKEIYVNPANELLAGFDLKEEGGLKRTYVKFAKLVSVDPREALL